MESADGTRKGCAQEIGKEGGCGESRWRVELDEDHRSGQSPQLSTLGHHKRDGITWKPEPPYGLLWMGEDSFWEGLHAIFERGSELI